MKKSIRREKDQVVIDHIKNASLYYSAGERIATALRFLEENDFSKMEPGRYEIDGPNIYFLVQHYESKPIEEGKWEAHRRYIDIQFVAEGEELIGHANTKQLKISQEYSEDKDFSLFEGEGKYYKVKEGMFMIFTPEDAHMPCIAQTFPQTIKKVVVKIRI